MQSRHWILGLALLFLGVILSLKYGATFTTDLALITQLRLPRVILAAAVGIGLTVAGATLQALFTNPLCEPYTLGISSGAALGAVIGSSLGLGGAGGLGGSAFVGAIFFTFILFLLAKLPRISSFSLLLAGVMLGFVGSSLVSLWMALADPNGIQGAIFWLMGDLSRARLSGAIFTLAATLILSFMIWIRSRELDGLLLGEEGALTLGIPVSRARRRLIILTALLVALCVSAAGMIGFVGLVIPHFARLVTGSLHRRLLPTAALWGAVAMCFSDLIARVAARPYELPVGIITALVGAPLFLWLMLRQKPRMP